MNLLRGGKKFKSIVGIERCSVIDWLLQLLYLVICGVLCKISVKKLLITQEIKERAGKLLKSDLKFTRKSLT